MKQKNAIAVLALLALSSVGAAVAQDGVRRVYLRDTARLVELRTSDASTLRCERNGGDEIKTARWVRDCNAIAREVLDRYAREGLLVETIVGRDPLGQPDASGELQRSVALRAGIADN